MSQTKEIREGFYLSEDGEWIPDEWSEGTVGMVTHCNQASLKKTSPFTKLLYLDTGSITKNKIEEFQQFDRGDEPSRARRIVKNNSIVYSTVRPNQEHYGILKNPPENLVVSTGFCVVDVNEEKASPLYLYYLLSQKQVTIELNQIAEQNTSAYPALSQDNIENFKFLSPPLPEQKAIAAVLSSLDDKIELLRDQNETLETLAQTLFKRWFIDFNFPACMALPCAGSTAPNRQAVKLSLYEEHPELSIYGHKDFGGMPQPQKSKSFIYVLRLENGNRYVGLTDFLLRRYHEHKTGKGAKATKASPPVAMIHFEEFDSREEAAEREQWLKTGFGRKWLDREEKKGNLGAHVVQAPMTPSELGEIPEGWRVESLDDFTQLIIDHRGKTPLKLKSEWKDSGYPAISAKNVKTGKIVNSSSIKYVDLELYDRWMNEKLQYGDVLMTSEAPLGELLWLGDNVEWLLSQRLYGLRAKKGFGSYLYFWLNCIAGKSDLESRASGSTVVGIRQSELRLVKIIMPSVEMVGNVSIIESQLKKAWQNTQQIQTLTQLRDTLLPKLMKGEIRIK